MPKKIEAIYIGKVPIFVYGQGVIKKGEKILVNERDLEREDIIRIIRIKKIKIKKIKKIKRTKKIKKEKKK